MTGRLYEAGWRVLFFPYYLVVWSWKAAAALAKGGGDLSAQVNQTRHEWLNDQEARELQEAKQLWVELAKAKAKVQIVLAMQ